MRNIIDVANQMKDMFESKKTKAEIDKVIRSVRVTAPEIMYERWAQLHDLMLNKFSEDKKQWSDKDIEIISVFSGNSVKEIKEEIDSQ